jgi:DHA3 family macrolide efflux protein-like MFS transporter
VAAPVGLAIAGPLSDAIGVRVWFVIGGLVTTALSVGAFFVPAIIRIEDKAARHEGG